LGSRLLQGAESAAKHAAGRSEARAVLGGNASTVQRDRTALLEHNGYKLAFTMLEMEGAASTVHSRPFPPGVMVRPARSADAAQVHALAQRAWASGPVRLHTEGHDPAGARSLYERLGFVTVREHHRFRRPLFG